MMLPSVAESVVHGDRRDDGARSSAWKRLQLIKAALLVTLLGLCVVQQRLAAWPIVTWPMYCCATRGAPSSNTSAIELRVNMQAGGPSRKLDALDFLPKGRNGSIERAIRSVFDDMTASRDANRIYLVNAAQRIIRTDELEYDSSHVESARR